MGEHVAYVGPRQVKKYYYNLGDLESLFHSSYAEKKGRREKYDFTVCDPFNNTYNPAKVSSQKGSERPFNRHFESALKTLIIKKKFLC